MNHTLLHLRWNLYLIMREKNWEIISHYLINWLAELKGGLSARMIYFLLKKENHPISAFVQSLFSTKKSPKVVRLPLTNETLCLSVWRHKQDKWLFRFSKLSCISIMYLFNSLAKSCNFWVYILQVIINTKRHSLVQFVSKSARFLRKQILPF